MIDVGGGGFEWCEAKDKRRKLRSERLRKKLYRKLATCTRQCRCGIAGLTLQKPRWHVEVLVRKGRNKKKDAREGLEWRGTGNGGFAGRGMRHYVRGGI